MLSTDGIEYDSLTAEPTTLADGMIWFRSDLNELRIRINGETKLLSNKWSPTAITLGDGFSNGATLSLTAGAGVYVDFDSASDDEYLFNVSLERNGLPYDATPIIVELYWMKFGATSGTVRWELDYAFVNIGDDAYTKVDGSLSETVAVGTLPDQTLTNTAFASISGIAGAKTLQLTLRRNSTGAGSDSYSGSAELYGFNLEV